MSGWTGEELQRIGGAPELRLAARRQDGSLRPFTTMWVVRAGDDLYVRSAGAFITGSDFLMDGGVTASYFFGELAPG